MPVRLSGELVVDEEIPSQSLGPLAGGEWWDGPCGDAPDHDAAVGAVVSRLQKIGELVDRGFVRRGLRREAFGEFTAVTLAAFLERNEVA